MRLVEAQMQVGQDQQLLVEALFHPVKVHLLVVASLDLRG